MNELYNNAGKKHFASIATTGVEVVTAAQEIVRQLSSRLRAISDRV